MDAMALRVGVIFGSRSVEHEVSIVTALQVMAALDRARYTLVPLYITKKGQWLTGDGVTRLETLRRLADGASDEPDVIPALLPVTGISEWLPSATAQRTPGGGLFGRRRSATASVSTTPVMPALDVAIPCTHGTYGEDGTVQGLLELASIPYVGCGVVASAVGMDKLVMKAIFQAAGLPVLPYLAVTSRAWVEQTDATLNRIEQGLRYPIFVKPANLGSSVGIGRATNRQELRQALDTAVAYDHRLIVEQGLHQPREINCAVLGGGSDRAVASVCEEPMGWKDILRYEDKYLSGAKTDPAQGMKGARRRIPADLTTTLTAEVQRLALSAYAAIDAAGVSRVDLLLDPATDTLYVNEINTIPGSLAFYLWEPSGLPFGLLLDRLIAIAQERHHAKSALLYSYNTPLLSRGVGAKAGKLIGT